jgi:hypothetical protein
MKDERYFEDMASRALPCPFCGERLVARNDHHGWWIAHKNETGKCIESVMQLFDEEDLMAWNTRSEPG